MKTSETIKILAIFLLFWANIFVWEIIFNLDDNLKVVFFDVGQGDSIFIETPPGHQILIDGGPSGKKILEKLSREMPFWDKSLDLIILTHPDFDHLAGLNYVLDSYRVENILWTGVIKENNTFEKWLEKIEKEGAEIFIAQKGQKIKAGQAIFYILHPFEKLEGEIIKNNSNDTSIVSKLVFGETAVLLTGDITSKVEDDLLPRSDLPVGLGADVLKIAHHGSKYSSSKGFIGLLQPKIAVISCGKNNSYGHPDPSVLQILENFAINVLRTDQLGDIEIVSNGNYFKIKD